ncbi:MAG: hypothetical protein PHW32_00790 [Bacilli bacterium]|nr:hypothetical protein [Bacilli bacterium]MDD4282186.1 hypothetical protein [Bacilli bacterium]MDD4718536.1 hypothetical protein [Bacilli bacterium]
MEEKDFELDGKKPEKDKKTDDYCVKVNVYTQCDKGHPWVKEDPCRKDKKDKNQCVEVNVYTECDK